jgi:hypothetical protein
MSRCKPLAALAVVMAALAVAAPAASAGTAKTSPAVHTAAVRSAQLAPGSLVCRILRFYSRTGTPPLNGLALGAYFTLGCGGP